MRTRPLILLAGCAAVPQRPALERIRVSPDGRGFGLADSGRPFVPWGFNYDRDHDHRLIEDYWLDDRERLAGDFREMKALGANVARVQLQLGRFMTSPDRVDPRALEGLDGLLAIAEETGVYLDVVGLGNFRKKESPAWYREADEKTRWAIQARFWEIVAARCAKSPAVFCYNLMNEPVSPRNKGADWHPGEGLGGFHYVEHISLDPKGRSPDEIARAWIATLTAPIRARDPGRLVTAGTFFLFDVPHGFTLGSPAGVEGLDHYSVHMYPKDGTVAKQVALLKSLPDGKPVVIEEMFPMNCSFETFQEFIRASRVRASGWMGFYWGRSREDMRGSSEFLDALMTRWLDWFGREAASIKP